MRYILNFYMILLIVLIGFKTVYWIYSDIPIGRVSIFILLLFLLFLKLRNSYTYFLLIGLILFCLAFKFLHQEKSGYLITDLLSSIHKPMESVNSMFLAIPYLLYITLFCVLLIPSTRKIYFRNRN